MQDFMKIFEQVKEAQAKIQQAQGQMVHLRATGEAGAGLVKVTVNGLKKLLAIEIDPSIIQPEDQQLLQDLIVAAANVAIQKADTQAKERLQETTAGMVGDMPFDIFT
jgi:DNA-binding YbaB/EbfC family protein